jgi:septal ring-binding cell division protein DamX
MSKRFPMMLALSAGMVLLGACSTTKVADPAPVTSAPVTTVPVQPIETQPPVVTQPTTPVQSSDQQVLLSQPTSAYTVQVLAAENPQTIVNFKNRYPGQTFYQIQVTRNNKPMYILYQGIYNSESAAAQAKRTFGDGVVTSLGSVQQRIRSGQ